MNWINIQNETQINAIIELSFIKPQAIFKHSTTCSISQLSKARLDRYDNKVNNIDFNYLDLLQNRSISNFIATKFDIVHESPQILLIKNGNCIYNESHTSIDVEELLEQLN